MGLLNGWKGIVGKILLGSSLVLGCSQETKSQSPGEQIAIGILSKDLARNFGKDGILLNALGNANIYMGLSRLDECYVRNNCMNHVNRTFDNSNGQAEFSRTFVASFFEDKNRDGSISLDEIIGIDRTRFSTDESILFGIRLVKNAYGTPVRIRVFNPRGEEIVNQSRKMDREKGIFYHSANVRSFVDNNGIGNYVVAFDVNETFWEARSFYISHGNNYSRTFVCNYIRDFNSDGSTSLDELIGIDKKILRVNEEVKIGAFMNTEGIAGKKLEAKVYCPNNCLVQENTFQIDRDYWIGNAPLDLGEIVKKHALGKYNVKFFFDGNSWDSRTFEVK